MAFTIPIILGLLVTAFFAYRSGRFTIFGGLVVFLLGFESAATGVAPAIRSGLGAVISFIVHVIASFG